MSPRSTPPGALPPLPSDHANVTATWLEERDMASWDAFVEQHPLGTVYQTTAWRNVLHDAFPHIRGRVLALRHTGSDTILGGSAVYTVESWLLGKRHVAVPFASRVDPVVDSIEHLGILLTALTASRAQAKARHLEVRTLAAPAPDEIPGGSIDRGNIHHAIDLAPGLDALLKATSRTYVRQPVQKTIRAGVHVRSGESDAHWSQFHALYTAARRRLSLPVMPLRLFLAIRRHLPSASVKLLLAERDGTVLGACVGLVFNGVYLLEWAGESDEGRRLGANKLLYWRAIEQAVAAGCASFSLGRTDAANLGLLEYKRHWGTTEATMPVLVWPASRTQARQESTRLRAAFRNWTKSAIRHSPPWFYERFSRFCYAHLG